MSTVAYIGIGSNLEDPEQQVLTAPVLLDAISDTQVIARSSLYASPPMGPPEQPDYVNAVAKIRTGLPCGELLTELQRIESGRGRLRGIRWGPRILDLDILLYGNETIDDDGLVVPHPGMRTRAFVIFPLHEIEPSLVLPSGEAIADLKLAAAQASIRRLPHGAA